MGQAARKLDIEHAASEAPPHAAPCPAPEEVLLRLRPLIQIVDRQHKAEADDPRPTQAAAARAMGCHGSTLGRYLKGIERPSAEWGLKAWAWMQLQEARRQDEARTPGISLASDAEEQPLAETAMLRAVERVAKLCLLERSIGLVESETSVGKTHCLKAYAAAHPAALYVACDNVTCASKRGILRAVLRASGLRGKGRTILEDWDALVECLSGGEKRALSARILLLDDAHVLPYQVLEVVRAIHDATGVPVLFCGTTRFSGRVAAQGDSHQLYEQLNARIGFRRTVGKASRRDCEAIARAWTPPGTEFTRDALDWLTDLALRHAFRDVRKYARAAARLPAGDGAEAIDAARLARAHRVIVQHQDEEDAA